MKKYLLLIVIMVLLVSVAPTSGADATAEEYAVYSAVIANMFAAEKADPQTKSKLLVIQDATATDRSRPNEVQGDLYFKQIFPTLGEGLARDYETRNNESAHLKDSFDLNMKYVLVDKLEIQKIFNNGGWWEEFYKRYPDSRGFIILSRVGFNPAKNQALVYIQHGCGGLCGTGNYVLLEKSADRWRVVNRSMVWIA